MCNWPAWAAPSSGEGGLLLLQLLLCQRKVGSGGRAFLANRCVGVGVGSRGNGECAFLAYRCVGVGVCSVGTGGVTFPWRRCVGAGSVPAPLGRGAESHLPKQARRALHYVCEVYG